MCKTEVSKHLFVCMRACECVCLCVCFNEWIKGEGSPLCNKKCNIVFFAPDNTFWQEAVTRRRDRCKYFGALEIHHNNSKRKWNNITFPSLFQENKLHCQYRFVKFHQRQWNLLSHVFFFFLQVGIEADFWCSSIALRGVIYCIITLLIFWGGSCWCVCVRLNIYSVCVRVFGLGDLWVYCPHKEN